MFIFTNTRVASSSAVNKMNINILSPMFSRLILQCETPDLLGANQGGPVANLTSIFKNKEDERAKQNNIIMDQLAMEEIAQKIMDDFFCFGDEVWKETDMFANIIASSPSLHILPNQNKRNSKTSESRLSKLHNDYSENAKKIEGSTDQIPEPYHCDLQNIMNNDNEYQEYCFDNDNLESEEIVPFADSDNCNYLKPKGNNMLDRNIIDTSFDSFHSAASGADYSYNIPPLDGDEDYP